MMRWKKIFSQRIFFQNGALENLKKDYKIVDMHVHTHYSHDSTTNIEALLRRAQKLGIGFAVTDHIRAEGAIQAAKQKKVFVIPGIEVASKENKEIILYFYNAKDLNDYYKKYIQNTKIVNVMPRSAFRRRMISMKLSLGMEEIVEYADQYDCLKCIPHPYILPPRGSNIFFSTKKMSKTMEKIDAIEIINSSGRPYMNKRATAWALKKGKAFTAGSDAHDIKNLGRSFVACRAHTVEDFLDAIKRKENIIMGEELKARAAIRNLMDINHKKRFKEW
jgi:predicted metal-dependent phosphoesterase TrpH